MRIRIPLPGPFVISRRIGKTGITLRNINAVRDKNRERRARVSRNLSNRAYTRELKRKKILY